MHVNEIHELKVSLTHTIRETIKRVRCLLPSTVLTERVVVRRLRFGFGGWERGGRGVIRCTTSLNTSSELR